MSIKEKRMQRCKELFGQFVSVQSLIDYLAAAESLCIDEVAAELEIAFVRNQANINRPAYGYVDEPSISFVPYSDQKAIDHLSVIFSDAIAFCDHGDASDHHGWLRDELFAFLQENGIDVPDNLPVWVPAAQPPQLIANGGGAISIEKPLGSRERTSLLCVVGALLSKLNIDPYNPAHGTSAFINRATQDLGAEVGSDTVSSILKRLPEAIDKRGL